MLDDYRQYALSWAGYDTVSSFEELNISKNVINDVYPIISEISHEVMIPQTPEDVTIIVDNLYNNINDLGAEYIRNNNYTSLRELHDIRRRLYDNIIYYLGDEFIDENNLSYLHPVPKSYVRLGSALPSFNIYAFWRAVHNTFHQYHTILVKDPLPTLKRIAIRGPLPETIKDLILTLGQIYRELNDTIYKYIKLHRLDRVYEIQDVQKTLAENIIANFGDDFVNEYLSFIRLYLKGSSIGKGLEDDEPKFYLSTWEHIDPETYIDNGQSVYIDYPKITTHDADLITRNDFLRTITFNKHVSPHGIRLFRSAMAKFNGYLRTREGRRSELARQKALVYSFFKPLTTLRTDNEGGFPSGDDFMNVIRLMARDPRLNQANKKFLLNYCVAPACKKILDEGDTYPHSFAECVKELNVPEAPINYPWGFH